MTTPSESVSNPSGPQKVQAKDGHIYHKSATANATTAPTNSHTVENVLEALPPVDLQFVSIVDYEYSLKGAINIEHLQLEYSIGEEEALTKLREPAIQAALINRGVPVEKFLVRYLASQEDAPDPVVAVAKRYGKLTPLQLVVANALIDLTDTRSEKKKLQDHGVSPKQYASWLRDPDFQGYMRQRAEGLLDNQHEAMLALMDKVRGGDMKAIQYYHELIGRFTPTNSSSGTNTTSHDIQQIVVRIVEIIIEEIDEPALAVRIADKIKGLVMGNQVAGVLPGPPVDEIVVPEIAKPRELTPAVQELMNRGVGYDS